MKSGFYHTIIADNIEKESYKNGKVYLYKFKDGEGDFYTHIWLSYLYSYSYFIIKF